MSELSMAAVILQFSSVGCSAIKFGASTKSHASKELEDGGPISTNWWALLVEYASLAVSTASATMLVPSARMDVRGSAVPRNLRPIEPARWDCPSPMNLSRRGRSPATIAGATNAAKRFVRFVANSLRFSRSCIVVITSSTPDVICLLLVLLVVMSSMKLSSRVDSGNVLDESPLLTPGQER